MASSRAILKVLQRGNRTCAPTTQTRPLGHPSVQWGSPGEAVVAADGEHDARERRRHVVRAERQRLARRAARVDPLRQHDRQPQLERARELRRPRVDLSGDEVGGAVGEVARVFPAERASRIFEPRAVGLGEASGRDLDHLECAGELRAYESAQGSGAGAKSPRRLGLEAGL